VRRLEGQVAWVTGGSRGIGRAVALAFAREGARVALASVHDREALEEAEREIKAQGVDSVAMLADVARRVDVDGFAQAIIARWGHIDVLVNNAGILRLAPLEQISEQRWDETLAVHLKGTFHCTQAVIPFMKEQGRGKIINVAAPSALRGSYGVADYAAAKGGIVAFTRNAANELKNYNIQVNCISPTANTRMTDALTDFRRKQLGVERREREFISADAIAPAFVFFASADSDCVTGQLLEVGSSR
jgi:3-oxoacyl-[acyl-carrier protein] reductase